MMKSIVEEASTIAKAINEAWIRAGKPKDFSVSVFEEPQHNILGFTKKNAKIALFFEEKTTVRKSAEKPMPAPVKKEKPAAPEPKKSKKVSIWTDAMADYADRWLDETLTLIGKKKPSFKSAVSDNYLRVTFDGSLSGNEATDKIIFRSFAHLLSQSMRTEFKKPFKTLKIVFS